MAEVIRKMGVSEQTFYRWKKKYSGLGPSELTALRVCLPVCQQACP